jgi:beta-N-acetylglucosaminidase
VLFAGCRNLVSVWYHNTEVIELKKTSCKRSRLVSVFLAIVIALSVPGLAFSTPPGAELATSGETSSAPQDTPAIAEEPATPELTPELTPTEPPVVEEPAVVEEVQPESGSVFEPLADAFNGAIVTLAYNPLKTQGIAISRHSTASSAPAVLDTQSAAASQRFRIDRQSDGWYTLTNIRSGLVLDVSGAVASPSAAIIQWPFKDSDNQKWAFEQNGDGSYVIVSKLNTALCLDVFGGGTASGTPLILWDKGQNKPNQQFVLTPIAAQVVPNGTYTVRAASGSTLLDIRGSSSATGTPALTYTPTNDYNQRFTFSYDAATGYYTILAVHSAQLLDVEGNSLASGAAVIQWSATGGFNQKWSVERDAQSGNLVICAANSGQALDVFGGSSSSGASIIVWPYHGKTNQQWVLNSVAVFDSGVYSMSVSSTGWLDVYAKGTANGTNIATWTQTSGMNQRFFVNCVAEGVYTVEDLNSNKYLTADGASGNAILYEWQNSDSQKWRFVPLGERGFALQSLSGAGALTAASLASGANVGVAALSNATAQRWKFVGAQPIVEGLYVFTSALNSSVALDIPGGSRTAGEQLTVWTTNEGSAQRFVLKQVSGSYYRVILLNSGLALDVYGSAVNATTGSGTVIQWPLSTNNVANQLWRIEYLGDGKIRFVSALAGERACLSVLDGQAASGAPVGVLDKNGSLAQAFYSKKLANVTTENLGITLDQMTGWQNGAVYSNGSAWVSAPYAQIYSALSPTQQQSDRILQFVDLRIPTGLSGAQIDAYINSGSESRSLFRGLGATFVAAANQYGLNEAYFVSHAINETGWGKYVCGDAAFTGFAYDGKTPIGGTLYPAGTYYNFWGIGAYDSNALTGGQNYAVSHGWNSPEAAIYGAAKWIAENYIYAGQPTLYDMRWDYGYYDAGGRGNGHKYATDIDWARKAARLMENLYASTGSPTLYYILPLYH